MLVLDTPDSLPTFRSQERNKSAARFDHSPFATAPVVELWVNTMVKGIEAKQQHKKQSFGILNTRDIAGRISARIQYPKQGDEP